MVKTKRTNQDNLSPPTWWRILLLCVLSSGCAAFEVLIFQSFYEGFIARNGWWMSVICCFLTAVGLALSVIVLCKGKAVLYRASLSAFFAVFLSLLVLFVIIKTDFITILRTPELYQEFLEKTGVWMPILYIFLQFLQVIMLPIPSLVSTLAGIALFGAFRTAIYSLIGIAAGSITAFLIGKKLGYKVVAWLIGEEELKKWLQKMKGKDALFLTMMFLLPLFPDDVLCFVAGLSTMSFAYFLVAMFVSRTIAIFATCFSIDFIPLGKWWGWLIWGMIFAVLFAGFAIIYKNMDKINAYLSRKKACGQRKRKNKNNGKNF